MEKCNYSIYTARMQKRKAGEQIASLTAQTWFGPMTKIKPKFGLLYTIVGCRTRCSAVCINAEGGLHFRVAWMRSKVN